MLGMLQNLVDTSLDPSKLKIYFTGDGARRARVACLLLPTTVAVTLWLAVVRTRPAQAKKCPALLTLALALCLPAFLFSFLSGHSLGGAIATLAAYDLLQMCPKIDRLRQVGR